MVGNQPSQDSIARLSMAVVTVGRPARTVTVPDGHDPASWLAVHGTAGADALVRSKEFCPSSNQIRHLKALVRDIRATSRAERPCAESPHQTSTRSI